MEKLPKNIVERINTYCESKKFASSKKNKLLEIVETRYNESLVSPGDAVGLIAAQSIGEPGTQLTLRTKHYAGSLEVSVGSGIQRVIEIVDGRSSAKYPSMKIYVNKELIKNEKQAQKFCNSLVDIKVKSVGDFKEDFVEKNVVFKLDLEKLNYFNLDSEKIITLIYDSIDNLYTSKRFSSNKTQINFHFDKDVSLYDIRKAVIKWNKIPLEGVKHIEKAVLQEFNGEFVITTKGSNLKEILKLEEVDTYNTITNDIFEIQKVFGVEAARECIITEFMETFKDNGISLNLRHTYLLADIMTLSGSVQGIVRTGITGHKSSPFARASFEETIKHILNAAFNNEVETLTGVVENIIVGQPICAGTGTVKLTLDPKVFKKMVKANQKLVALEKKDEKPEKVKADKKPEKSKVDKKPEKSKVDKKPEKSKVDKKPKKSKINKKV